MRDLDLGHGLLVPANLLRSVTSRSSGPGGQAVNKLETRVTIELPVGSIPGLNDGQIERIRRILATRINREGVLRVTSQAGRSQLDNRDIALARMEELLRGALEEQKPRKPTRVSRAAKARRIEAKKRIGERKRERKRIDRD